MLEVDGLARLGRDIERVLEYRDVIRVNQRQARPQMVRKRSTVNSEYSQHLIGPMESISLDIPFPITELRHALRLGQLFLTARQRFEGLAGTKQITHPVGKDGPGDRLGDKIGGPAFVCPVDRHGVIKAGHHKDWNARPHNQAAQGCTSRKSIHAGHHHIEQHHIGTQGLEQHQAALAFFCLLDAKATGFERLPYQHAHHAVVVDYQDQWRVRASTRVCQRGRGQPFIHQLGCSWIHLR